MTEVLENDWIAVHRFTAQAGAEQHALKLAAVGIGCRLVAREDQRQSRSSPPMRALVEGFDGALAYCAVFLFLHGTCRRQLSSDWWSAGAAQAGLIVDGEWYRTFTALGLHVDLGRLASNLVVGSLLGLLFAQLLGAGLAWVAILLGGAMGNALNALLHPRHTRRSAPQPPPSRHCDAPRRHHQGRQSPRPAGPDRGRLDLPFCGQVGRGLHLRNAEQPKEVRAIVWKAQLRLCGRYRRVAAGGKPKVVVTTAMAREMAGFVWAIACRV